MSCISSISNNLDIKQNSSNENKVYYHKVELEIVKPRGTTSSNILTTSDKIKNVVADTLIIIGVILAFLSLTAITLQTAGVTAPCIPIMANLLMPAVATLLTGYQLSNDKLKMPEPQMSLPVGIPGITIKA